MQFKSLILITIFLTIITLPFLSAYSGPSTQVKATLVSQTPDPVEPGQIVTIKFKIENSGKESTQDTIVALDLKYPLSVYGNETQKNIGKLRASSSGSDAEIVEFKIKVDERAVEGDAPIDLNIKMGDAAVSYTNKEFLLNIQTQNAILDISSITFEPENVRPGEPAEISMRLKNSADTALKNIKLKLSLSDVSLPFAPYQSSSERLVSVLPKDYQHTISFKIITDPKTTAGLYKVPLNISYFDERGQSYSSSEIIAVSVGDAPAVRPLIKKSTVLQSNHAGKLTIEVANPGTMDVKYLELYLLPSPDYNLVSTSDYFYIGKVDSDDTQSEEIDIYINKEVENVLNFPVKLKYHDANGNAFDQQFDLTMNIYSSSELKRFGVIQSSNAWFYIILFIILGIGGYYLYQRNNNKKSK